MVVGLLNGISVQFSHACECNNRARSQVASLCLCASLLRQSVPGVPADSALPLQLGMWHLPLTCWLANVANVMPARSLAGQWKFMWSWCFSGAVTLTR